ncbi:MAG TPA: hypothetical protein VGC79_37215 [Polyangiaceae bacterium]
MTGTHGSMPRHAVIPLAMTRKQVADRLGRSLATVRRLEGTLLHPQRDARGVHHFDRDEVEGLARDLNSGRISIGRNHASSTADGAWDHDADAECQRCSSLQEQVDALNDELASMRNSHRREIETLQTEATRTQERLRSELAELESEVAEFVSVVEESLA